MSFMTSAVSACGHVLPGTRSNRLLILIYHRVHPRPDPMFPGEVDARRFDQQMALLRRHCNPLPLAEAVERLKRGQTPPRAVAITFDDGYADNATVALPILQRHGVPATVFVATGFLNGGRMWNDTIIESVRRALGDSLDLAPVGLGVEPLGPEATRGALAERIIKSVKDLHPLERSQKVDALRDAIGQPLPDDLMLSSQQVRSLADAGIEVGAHTINHPILKSLPFDDVRREIDGSRAELERITGRTVKAFAYPNGRPGDDYTQRDRDIVESLGFSYAPATRWGVASSATDPYQLPRFTPWDRSPTRWLARLLMQFRSVV
jgi:peptidoglycan/xylan/chitin deacetylase (PgdA/CDA1 family)